MKGGHFIFTSSESKSLVSPGGVGYKMTTVSRAAEIGLRDGEMDDYTKRHVLRVIVTLRKAAAGRPRRHRGRKWEDAKSVTF